MRGKNTKISAKKKQKFWKTFCFFIIHCVLLTTSELFFSVELVRNSQFLATLSTARCQYAAAVSCCHSLAETVLVSSFSVRRLECSLHCMNFLIVIIQLVNRVAKIVTFF